MKEESKNRAYDIIASEAIKYELPYDKYYDYILIHHIPKDTDRGNMIRQEINYRLRKAGFKAKMEWMDNWTLKVEV